MTIFRPSSNGLAPPARSVYDISFHFLAALPSNFLYAFQHHDLIRLSRADSSGLTLATPDLRQLIPHICPRSLCAPFQHQEDNCVFRSVPHTFRSSIDLRHTPAHAPRLPRPFPPLYTLTLTSFPCTPPALLPSTQEAPAYFAPKAQTPRLSLVCPDISDFSFQSFSLLSPTHAPISFIPVPTSSVAFDLYPSRTCSNLPT